MATRLLARDPVDTLAILGAGVQARSHLDAMLAVRRFRHVRVCSRRLEQAERFAAESHAASIAIEPVAAAEAAVRGADVVVTATSSKTPVLNRDWLAAGTHVNAVGSSIPKAREIDGATMAAASLYVDRRESTLNESGDYLAAAREDLVGPDDLLAELGEVLTGQAPGRQSEDEITLFKSLGLAVEDLAAAQHAVTRARALGLGRDVEF